MIQLEQATRVYRLGDERIQALDSVDITIEDGDFVAVMGPSASGKTTMANVIGGLDRLNSGRVVVNGRDLSKYSDSEMSRYRNKHVGFVFQNFNLHTWRSALSNVTLPLLFAKVGRRERARLAGATLERLGMANRLNHRPHQLSGGQRQVISFPVWLVVGVVAGTTVLCIVAGVLPAGRAARLDPVEALASG